MNRLLRHRRTPCGKYCRAAGSPGVHLEHALPAFHGVCAGVRALQSLPPLVIEKSPGCSLLSLINFGSFILNILTMQGEPQ